MIFTHTAPEQYQPWGTVFSKFSDSTMFNLNETESDGKTTKYLLTGGIGKGAFQYGNLAGYEFEIHAYDHATHTFTLKK